MTTTAVAIWLTRSILWGLLDSARRRDCKDEQPSVPKFNNTILKN